MNAEATVDNQNYRITLYIVGLEIKESVNMEMVVFTQ